MELRGKKVVVVGLGRSGLALAEFLHQRGAQVIATDQKTEDRLDGDRLASLRALGIQLELGGHTSVPLLESDMVLLSPGVPLTIDLIRRTRDARIPIWGEVELAARFLKGRLVGITGSNGKTTVTSLIGALLSRTGVFTQIGGNIGTPLTRLIESSREDGFIVVELSSFQLETIESLHPYIAVVTNISADHLDRHGTLGAYISAKRRIFMNQTESDWAVLNADDPVVIQMMYGTQARTILFSRRRDLDEGVFVQGDQIVCRMGGNEQALIGLDDIPLRGWHNVENVMAALAAGIAAGAAPDSMREAIQTFPGVEHRLELVGQIDGVDYYNDSKATNVDSTVKAVEAFAGNVILILGGRDKGTPYEPLRLLIRERVKHVLLLGEATERMAHELQGTAPMTSVGSLKEAVEHAHELARPGDTVLLAPACASFDMFENFEQRGGVFKDEVRKLKLMSTKTSRLELHIEETGPLN